ncbi:DNA-methyltransferase [Megasphaera sueciensis]|uniref:DNA-methyltransferase n=1 Tax=Megasphaera sueciensis TaxID=349094 RepID=UPI003CFD243D
MEKNKIYCGDALEVLKTFPDESVNCCVTSPPYYGLRDYGMDGQIGLEINYNLYVNNLEAVLSEVKRVLKNNGTLWLNLGDTYGQNWRGGSTKTATEKQFSNKGTLAFMSHGAYKIQGLKQKELLGIPWKVAFALQQNGWYLRQDIIWHKTNPMPESVRDRCTKSHEYIFLMTKQPKYYFDNDAIKEPCAGINQELPAGSEGAFGPQQSRRRLKGNAKTFRGGVYTENKSFDNSVLQERDSHGNTPNITGLRNKRDVWDVSTKGFKGAHFATFPEELITPCILAGCPEGGIVLDPFFGSGTTGAVAFKHNRYYVGIELNPEYVNMAEHRIDYVAMQKLDDYIGRRDEKK